MANLNKQHLSHRSASECMVFYLFAYFVRAYFFGKREQDKIRKGSIKQDLIRIVLNDYDGIVNVIHYSVS